MKFSGVTILQGVEFSIIPIDFEWALQQCSATALRVILKLFVSRRKSHSRLIPRVTNVDHVTTLWYTLLLCDVFIHPNPNPNPNPLLWFHSFSCIVTMHYVIASQMLKLVRYVQLWFRVYRQNLSVHAKYFLCRTITFKRLDSKYKNEERLDLEYVGRRT